MASDEDRVQRIVLVVALIGLATSSAPAQEPTTCPEPQASIPRGLNVRTALGPAVWAGDIGRDARTGFAFAFGAGYEFFSWLAAEVTWTTGFHTTDQPAPPATGSFTTHAFHAGARFSLPLEPFDLFVRGGIGAQWSKPDILVRVDGFDGDTRLAWMGGLGLTWHTPRRHFWIGLEANALGAVDFPGILVVASAVLGFTL